MSFSWPLFRTGLLLLPLAAMGCTDHAALGGALGADAGLGPDQRRDGGGAGSDCLQTNGGIEICDYLDNDCDGLPDEGFDLSSDRSHCGACGLGCSFDNAAGRCVDRFCVIEACAPGYADIDGVLDNGCESSCQPTNAGIEVCDEVDNDCDGDLDEGFRLLEDPNNCGRCGARCTAPGATPVCERGECGLGVCDDGLFDLDGDPENGCEASCVPSEGGVEACDGLDNDCDELIDEATDLFVDRTNCGACGVVCSYPNAPARCVAGRCEMGDCDPGFADFDRDDANGCEALCTPSEEGIETCDLEDNDCDGSTDEGFDLAADPSTCGGCEVFCAFNNAAPECVDGECLIRECEPGFVNADGAPANGCETACVPDEDPFEHCDGRDNDCNGLVDDGWDFQADPFNCGTCGELCAFANAQAGCDVGRCVIEQCELGFADIDGHLDNGCEALCTVTHDGNEICDEVDNDCDGRTDEDFDFNESLQHCGGCHRACALDHAVAECLAATCRVASCEEGWFDADHNPRNGCEYRCELSEGGVERCDGLDNDCDGRTDEGFDLERDLDNCGRCGGVCERQNAMPVCHQGICTLGVCEEGWHDADGDPESGCELQCNTSRGGVEVCDGEDNDCNGQIDDGFDLQRDPNNCGGCGRSCVEPHRISSCVQGACQAGECEAGWYDLDQEAANGCEYACAGDGEPERCNQVDDDCDGVVDEGFDTEQDPANCGVCGRVCGAENAQVACVAGLCRLMACEPGFHDADASPLNGCEYACVVEGDGVELCDGQDNDCNGLVDELTDLDNDLSDCGECGRRCDLGGATAFCDSGECAILQCEPGRRDVDGVAENGCECTLTHGGVERCDGLDNDCDGVVDNQLGNPPITCRRFGVCEGVSPRCEAAAWTCNYPQAFEAEGETRCDGLDNDCDGQLDEAFPGLGDACAEGLGRCRDEGTMVCNPAGEALICSAEERPELAREEICNGEDDDCDGDLDEDSDDYVQIGADLQMYRYEASRTDASQDSAGVSFQRACSSADVVPWQSVDWQTAARACARANARLCTEQEWRQVCSANGARSYPYGDSYLPLACNGSDHPADAALATGSLPQCASLTGVLDLSGNVWEWLDEDLSDAGDGSIRAFIGGGYGNIAAGLRCDFSVASSPDSARDNIGFRCCRDLACVGVECEEDFVCKNGLCEPL